MTSNRDAGTAAAARDPAPKDAAAAAGAVAGDTASSERSAAPVSPDSLSGDLLDCMRSLRPLNLRLVIGLHNPSHLPPQALELASVVVVHRLSSPAWMRCLAQRLHLDRLSVAAVAGRSAEHETQIEQQLRSLDTGQALLYCAQPQVHWCYRALLVTSLSVRAAADQPFLGQPDHVPAPAVHSRPHHAVDKPCCGARLLRSCRGRLGVHGGADCAAQPARAARRHAGRRRQAGRDLLNT